MLNQVMSKKCNRLFWLLLECVLSILRETSLLLSDIKSYCKWVTVDRSKVKLKRTTWHIPVFEIGWISKLLYEHVATNAKSVLYCLCPMGGNDEACVTLSKHLDESARRTLSQACSYYVLRLIHSAQTSSIQPFRRPLSDAASHTQVSYSTSQLLSSLPGPPPFRPPFLLQDAVQWRANRHSETVLVLMCLSAEEITRKQLARGRQLLFPTARRSFWGTTAGCHGGEVARRPCCCSQPGP